ncbi:MAG: hypothetical protein BWY91_02360 [bacterium ADurb.BinA028]|nr:MAG: hypothetical protein BWY91_02360 [bacterium ADurb.BinA028]
MRLSPLPLVQLTPNWSDPTEGNNRAEACSVGSAATSVCTPPAVVEPLLVAAAKVTSFVVIAATLIVFSQPGFAAMSAVMKTYPVLAARIAWDRLETP